MTEPEPAVQDGVPIALVEIDGHLGQGRLGQARRQLDALQEHSGALLIHLRTCLAACEDAQAGRLAQADHGFGQIAASTLPLPGVQMAAGRHWLARGQPQVALASLARAQLCGLPVADQLMGWSKGATAAPELLRVGVIGPRRYDINRAMTLKRRLLRELVPSDAAAAYAALFSVERGRPDIATLPLHGLRDHASAHGDAYHEVMPSARLRLPMSQIVGQPPAGEFEAHGRTLFVAAVADAIVVSRSNLVQVPGAVLYDCQDDELACMPPDFACDGQGFAFQDGLLSLVRWGAPAVELDQAISLLGCGSMNFGHWTGEFLYRLMLIDSLGLAPGAPVLVDAGMPASHGEALRWFTGGARTVIEVAPAGSARVRRLWLASTPSYTPFVPRAGTPILNERLCAQTTAVAELLARQRYPADRADAPRRVYLDRGPALKRRVAGDEELQGLLQAHGFVRVQLETLPFVEQLQLVRGATHVVGPAGSALLLAFLFGRPGQRILNLHPPALDETPSLTSLAAARGVEVAVLMGTHRPGTPPGARNADFDIDLALVRRVLATWWPGGGDTALR